MAAINILPDFDSLPPVEGMPHGCAWGVFDSDGKKDHLGCLNLLTPSVVREAYKEARDGVSISLNAPLDTVRIPLGRKALTHKIINWNETANFSALDDDIEFNTQCSTQWDSLLHYYHQPSGTGYNGNAPSKEQLEQPTILYDREKKLPTLDHWHDRGGIVGRGVLLDYRQYAREKGIRYQVFSNHTITTHDIEAIATYQGVQLKHGDILIIRSGYTEDLMNMSAEEQQQGVMSSGGQIGVEGNLDSVKWFWNNHFSAVAGDMMAFEVVPPKKEDGTPGDVSNLVLHPYFLSMFGLNIGELWNLKALGEHCAKTKRYSFLLTSIPLNIPGLVGSPANALAIF